MRHTIRLSDPLGLVLGLPMLSDFQFIIVYVLFASVN